MAPHDKTDAYRTLKRRPQFVRTRCCSSYFANHDTRSLIRKGGRFNHASAYGESTGKSRNYSIASAGDIVNLTGRGRHVIRLVVTSEQHHSSISAGDEYSITLKPIPDQLCSFMQAVVRIVFTVSDTQSLMMVGCHQCGRFIGVEVAKLWIDQHRQMLVRERQNFCENTGCNRPFIVIRDHQSMSTCQFGFDASNDLFLYFMAHRIAAFTISAYNELI